MDEFYHKPLRTNAANGQSAKYLFQQLNPVLAKGLSYFSFD
jgi:hypothetical protein